jgi:hypothetical protein
LADLTSWLLVAIGPGYLLFRRVFYGFCFAAGTVIALREERDLTEREAYELGRQKVLKTAIDTLSLRLASVDWKGLGAGIKQAALGWRAHALIAWRGFKRDYRLARDWVIHAIMPKRQRLKAQYDDAALRRNALLNSGEFDFEPPEWMGPPSTEDHGKARADYATLVRRPRLDDADYAQITILIRQLRAYGDNPLAVRRPNAPAIPVPLISPLAGLAALASPWPRVAIGAVVVGGLMVWGQQQRVERLKDRNEALEQGLGKWEAGVAERDARLGKLQADIKVLGVKCIEDQKAAADRRAAQEARARAADVKARRKLNEAATSAGVAQPFDLDGRLRELAEPVGTGPAPDADRPAENVAGGMSGAGPASPAAADGGQ